MQRPFLLPQKMDLLFIETNSNKTDLGKQIVEYTKIQRKNIDISQKIKLTMQLISKLSSATKTSYVQASLKAKK